MKRTSTGSGPKRALAVLAATLIAVGPLLLAARPAQAASTFSVGTVGDQFDVDPNDGICDASAGPAETCTLRAAIEQANASLGADTIVFHIPGRGVKTIRPSSPLPLITERLTIEGATQPGASANTLTTGTNAVLLIELDGSAAGNADGLDIQAAGTLVRGLVINRFAGVGIQVFGAATSQVRIEGNFLGTNAAGTAARGNGSGVLVYESPNSSIGGGGQGRSLISGNRFAGVRLAGDSASNIRVVGNLIGTDKTGAAPLGNSEHGVASTHRGAFIGGTTAAEANVIAFNVRDGVAVVAPGARNRILRNAIFGNGGLGIDLANDGPTANDPDDPDDGANTLQNAPVITAATRTEVRGRLNSIPNRTFVLRLFSNSDGGNEGKLFKEERTVTTDAAGNATFAFATTPSIPAGQTVTATATNAAGNTSEFSAARAVV